MKTVAAHRDVSVPWLAKALAYNLFEKLPGGASLYYLLQRHVTRTIPRKYAPTSRTGGAQIRHADLMRQHFGSMDDVVLFEFGAGWDLYSNLIYYCMGLQTQYTVDVERWARAESVNAAILHLQKDPPSGSVRTPDVLVDERDFAEQLLTHYGIRYLAPFDATQTDLPDASIDVITSTSVLEHVPKDAIASILAECRRIIRPSGLMSHTVDYSDHYAHADPSITSYNYVRFGNGVWKLFNPPIHYQNRLRTRAYDELFARSDFDVVAKEEWLGSEHELMATPIHCDFRQVDRSELLTLGCHYLLQPGSNPTGSNGQGRRVD